MSKIGHIDDIIALKTILFCPNLSLVSEQTLDIQYCRFAQHLTDAKRQYITPPHKNDQNLMTSLRKF